MSDLEVQGCRDWGDVWDPGMFRVQEDQGVQGVFGGPGMSREQGNVWD